MPPDELPRFSHDRMARQKRPKANRAQQLGKTEGAGCVAARETEAHLSEGRDPFANLRHLEKNRPGFQWRSRQDLKTLVHGIEDSKGNNSAY